MKKVSATALAVALSAGSIAVQAYEAGDWILRFGATTVSPDAGGDKIVIPTDPPTVLDGVDIDDDTQLGIIPAYMITDNWGLELLAATPFEHNVDVAGTSIKAGKVTHLPPTLTLHWYPRGGNDGWQPYFGLGLNYTFIYDEKVDGQLEEALGALIGATKADLRLDDSFGFSASAGVDFPFGEHWGINLGIWYIDIESKAEIATDVGNVKFDVKIDPWVYNVGLAYKF